MKNRLLLFLLVIVLGGAAVAYGGPIITLTLNPASGVISGLPGQTVGWGFTLTNSGAEFLVPDSFQFCVDVSCFSTPTGGTFTDFTQFNFYVVGPPPESATETQAFDPVLLTGVGSFAINPSDAPGDVIAGNIVLTYDLYSCDPTSPTCSPTISPGNTISDGAEVAVVATPEPGTLLLLSSACGLGLLLLASRRRRGSVS